MMTILSRALLPIALAALGGITAVSAQTRKEQADRVVKQYGAPSPACALLTKEEFAKITGRHLYTDANGTQLTNGGSACDFDSGNVTLFSGPKSAENYEQLLKNFKKDQTPRQPVSGIGESAYLMYPKPRDRHEGNYAVLVVRQGVHTMAVALEAQGNEAPQSLQPQLMAMARAALAKLR
jgi:hypothetical protein